MLFSFFLAISATRASTVDSAAVDLQLDVKINGFAINLIGAFTLMPDGHMASRRSELTELGVNVASAGPPDELIVLDSIPGVSYVYDESSQLIELELPDKARTTQRLKVNEDQYISPVTSDTGLLVNYTAYTSANYDLPGSLAAINGANLSLDARAFSKIGTLRQSGILGTTTFSELTALRLDTNWSYSDPSKMLSYRLGDIIGGGLRWTRPVRMGGAQVQRNFDLRPDLVTMPLPRFAGSASVPSTLDVYIGDTKAYSANVEPGPFSLDKLPVFTNTGTARMVLTDSSGRSVATESDFFTSPDLLSQGLYDYSVDFGVVRRGYGTDSFGYDNEPVGLGSLRYGITDWVTGEAHAEAMQDLVEVGIGAVVSANSLGVFSGAISGSKHGSDEGLFLFGSWEGHFGNLSINASTIRTFGSYWDVSAATELPIEGEAFSSSVPRALDQVSVGYSIPVIDAGVGLSLIHQDLADGESSFLLSGSFTKSFDIGPTVFATGFWDQSDRDNFGGFVGISMPLGRNATSTAGVAATAKSWTVNAEASRPLGSDSGSYGWRVNHSEGEVGSTGAGALYRTDRGVAEANISQSGENFAGNASFSGSAVMADGGLFFSDLIPDSFAIVDTQTPDVKVNYENRFYGTTGKNGKLLVPKLRSFQKNRISIDVNDLPLNALATDAERLVVPGDGVGVVVDFGVKKDSAGVLVTLLGSDGDPLPAGTEVVLNGESEPFLVGFDGEVYVTDAKPKNTLTAQIAQGSCEASFSYVPDSQVQAVAGPLRCQ